MPISDEDLKRLRRMAGEVDGDYSDEELTALYEEHEEDLDKTAEAVWTEKANSYAELTDISEAGSSRKNSVLYDRAIARARHYGDKAEEEEPGVEPGSYSTTRRIVRA